MPIIYHVTIKATKKENIFRINWTGIKNKTHSFEQSSVKIMPEEVEWMWKDRRNQLRIGEKLFRFLDGAEHYFQQALKQAHLKGEMLRVHLATCRETGNWPFELLARDGSFLLPKRMHLVRSIPGPRESKELPPQNRPLKLLFMACSPLDIQSELDFEKEEEAIFKITRDLTIDMEVEDTGSLEGLQEKLEQQQYDIIHLSGHAGVDKKGRPFFAMEDETGYRRDVSTDELWHDALSIHPPKLLFISGDRTGDAPEGTENSIAHRLVETYGIQTVLGWGRWLNDGEAKEAAKEIYKDLSRGESIIAAVQRTRYRLINRFPETLKPAWPLLRLFSRGVSFNAIVEKEQKWRPPMRQMTHTYLQNSRVKVLREGFVGRRRQLQQSIRILKQDRGKIGLLLLGTGGLGKSCLAGKISERFGDHTLIIVHGKLNSITLKSALKDAFILSRDDYGKNVLSWDMGMKEMLGVMCRSCFKNKKYLILLDDFEQNLEGSEEGEPGGVFPEAAELLKVLMDCLPDTGKTTQTIITCRYRFSFEKEGRDLLREQLESIWLTGFRQVEQKKKVRVLPHISKQKESTTIDRLLTAGCGNPRLMEWIDVLVGETDKTGVTELLQEVFGKKREFIQKHVINELLDRGGEELTRFMRRFAIYRIPVLKEGAKAVGEKTGLKSWEDLLYRGMDLSLIEHDRAHESYQGTPLLRDDLLSKLDNLQACHEAAFAYYKSICEGKPEEQFDPIQVEEWVYHALEYGEEDIASDKGGDLVNHLAHRLAFLESQRVGEWIMKRKERKLSTRFDAYLLSSMAHTRDDLGDYREAISYFEQSLSMEKVLFGETHPRIAEGLNSLGEVWQILGNPKKAIDYYQKALTVDEAVFGPGHPNAARELNNLGSAWFDLRKYREAIDYFERALTIDESEFGRQHPRITDGLNSLGLAWKALGDYSKAIDYFQQALTIDKELFDDEHPHVARELNNLGASWGELGNYRKAIYFYREALTIDEKVFGPQHADVATNLNNLGSAWEKLGDYREAVNYYRRALTINEVIFGSKHPRVAAGLNNLGAACEASGEYREAIRYFERALKLDEAAFGKHDHRVAIRLNNLGAAWGQLGEHQKSIDYYRKALAIDGAIFEQKHPKTAIRLNNLGTSWFYIGEYQKAIDCFEQAMSINETAYGRQHPRMAAGFDNLGSAWEKLGDYRKAVDYYRQALAIDEEVLDPQHGNVAQDLYKLGVAQFKLGQKETAGEHLERAYKVFNKLLGANHPKTKKAAEWLEKLKEKN